LSAGVEQQQRRAQLARFGELLKAPGAERQAVEEEGAVSIHPQPSTPRKSSGSQHSAIRAPVA
jgi:hypothetical protein